MKTKVKYVDLKGEYLRHTALMPSRILRTKQRYSTRDKFHYNTHTKQVLNFSMAFHSYLVIPCPCIVLMQISVTCSREGAWANHGEKLL